MAQKKLYVKYGFNANVTCLQ